MLKDNKYSVYTTPFKFKSKSQPKISQPSQSSNYKSVFNLLFNSPYIIKNTKEYRSRKVTTANNRQQVQRLNQFSSQMKLRIKSAPYHFQPDHMDSNKFQINNLLSQEEKVEDSPSHRKRAETFRKIIQKSASNKRINLQKQLNFSPVNCFSVKKFTLSKQKASQKQKNRDLIDQKLEKYNYKTVLGEAISTKPHRIPKIIINQQGIISRAHY